MPELVTLGSVIDEATAVFDCLVPNSGTSLVASIANGNYTPAVGDAVVSRHFDGNRVEGTGFQYKCTSATGSAPLLADGITARTELGTSGGLKYWGDPFFFWVELTAGGNVAKFENEAFSRAIKLTGHGQSNMTGFQPDDGPGYTNPPVDAGTSPLVWIWNQFTTKWEIWDQTSDPAQYGNVKSVGAQPFAVNNDCPMFHLARKVADTTGSLVLVLMNARGGTDLSRWLPGVGDDLMWNDYTDQVTESGLDRISHAFWLHGENQEVETVAGTYDYITEWEKWRTAMLARSEFDAGTPVTIGQIRDFRQNSGVRLGTYNGVNGDFLRFFDGEDPQMYVAPIKDLESSSSTTPDGDNHYSRASIREIGREHFFKTFCGVREAVPRQLADLITQNTTYTVDEGGYYTDRINGTFDTLKSVMDFLQFKRIRPGVTITININARAGGAYYSGAAWEDLVISHPDFTQANVLIQGAALSGAAPSMTGTKATDVAALETYIPTHITGRLIINSPVTINRLLVAGPSGTGIAVTTNANVLLRWFAFLDATEALRVETSSDVVSTSNGYLVHCTSYGARVHGKLIYNGSTNIAVHNTTADLFAANTGIIFGGSKTTTVYSPTRGSGFSSTGGSCH